MSPAARNGLWLVVLAVMVGGAVWRFSKPKEDALPPDTAASATDWMCVTCGNLTVLTARQAADWREDPKKTRYGKEFDAKQTVYHCDACGTFSVVRARLCPVHDEWWFRRGADGSPGGCSGCAAGRP